MNRFVGAVISFVVGGVLAGVTGFGLLQSQAGNTPYNANSPTVPYGSR